LSRAGETWQAGRKEEPSVPERAGQPAKLGYHFIDRILVDCPQCGGLAIVRLEQEDGDRSSIGWAGALLAAARRMTCTRCAAHRRQGPRAWTRPAMGLSLRLRADTRHGTLYAYNEDHLDYIEAYVRSGLRREIVEPGGIRNQSIASRLPRWVKAAANRAEVLKAIATMRKKLTAS
jgi:hypothetical protein